MKIQLANWRYFDIRYFGSKPTSVTSESNVRIGESAMPWHGEAADGKVYKYQYHPHGDKNQPLRAAPSAMNTVIVPNVTLPEVCRSNSLVGRFAITTALMFMLFGRLPLDLANWPKLVLSRVADHFVLSYRTSTRSSTSTARRSGTTKRLLRSPLKDGARANGHLYVSDRLLYTRVCGDDGGELWVDLPLRLPKICA